MAEAIVDGLESVQIDQADRERPAPVSIRRSDERSICPSIEQPGERIVRAASFSAASRLRIGNAASSDCICFTEFAARRRERLDRRPQLARAGRERRASQLGHIIEPWRSFPGAPSARRSGSRASGVAGGKRWRSGGAPSVTSSSLTLGGFLFRRSSSAWTPPLLQPRDTRAPVMSNRLRSARGCHLLAETTQLCVEIGLEQATGLHERSGSSH